MTTAPDKIDPTELLRHRPALASLARQLVADHHRAEDLVQDAWLAALQRPPRAREALSSWLRRVLRHRAYRERQRESERPAREAAAARPEAVADSAEASLEGHRVLLAAVSSLREPMREAIVLRYYRGLGPREIAARLGVPVATAKTRLRRGLAELREALDDAHGNRRGAWVVALVPLTLPGRPSLPIAAPGAPLVFKVVVAVLFTLAGSAGFDALNGPGVPSAARATPSGDPRSAPPPDVAAAGVPAALSPRRVPAPLGERARLDEIVVQVVRQSDGRPMAGATVVLQKWATARQRGDDRATTASVRGITDASGRVVLESAIAPPFEIVVTGPDACPTVARLRRTAEQGAVLGPLVVELEADAVRGEVYWGRLLSHAEGRPVAGATIELQNATGENVGEVYSGADGRFAVARRAAVARAVVAALGYAPIRLRPGGGHASVDAAQELRLVAAASLAGRCVDAHGRPIAGVVVAATAPVRLLYRPNARSANGDQEVARWTATSTAAGSVELSGLPVGVPLKLGVSVDGVVVAGPESITLQAGQRATKVWHLGARATIAGHVVERGGEPAAGIEVWLARARTEARGFLTPERRERSAQTDRTGAFSFEAVGPGAWWVGPGAVPAQGSIAPVGELVRIEPSDDEARVEVRLERELYIRGRVIDVDGVGLARYRIHGHSKAASGGRLAYTEADGGFVYGPLAAGVYHLVAVPVSGGGDRTRSVAATAGDRDVVLQTWRAGAVAGEVVGATDGRALPAALSVIRAPSPNQPAELVGWLESERPAPFHFPGLRPGPYVLFARTADGQFGLQRVDVTGGPPSDGLAVPVAPGARLSLQAGDGHQELQYSVWWRDLVLCHGSLRPGMTAVETVPPGELSVRVRANEPSGRARTVAVELAEGDLATVDLARR
ncbi:MAG: sigma-70 family RNA polymerase sigma factor [Planctomycetota bacterium]